MAGFIKKGDDKKLEYDAHRVQELLRCAMDPAYFVNNYIQIQHPTKGMIPFKLYPYQIKMLKTMQANRKVITLSARQTGKCFLGTLRVAELEVLIKSPVRMFLLKIVNRPLYEKIVSNTGTV